MRASRTTRKGGTRKNTSHHVVGRPRPTGYREGGAKRRRRARAMAALLRARTCAPCYCLIFSSAFSSFCCAMTPIATFFSFLEALYFLSDFLA